MAKIRCIDALRVSTVTPAIVPVTSAFIRKGTPAGRADVTGMVSGMASVMSFMSMLALSDALSGAAAGTVSVPMTASRSMDDRGVRNRKSCVLMDVESMAKVPVASSVSPHRSRVWSLLTGTRMPVPFMLNESTLMWVSVISSQFMSSPGMGSAPHLP